MLRSADWGGNSPSISDGNDPGYWNFDLGFRMDCRP
jgi:hypothetical protein